MRATVDQRRPGEWERPVRERLWRVPPRRWPRLARSVIEEAGRDRVTTIAASLAFHGFLAVLPLSIAAIALLNLVGLSTSQLHALVHAVSVLLPRQMSTVVNHQLLQPPSRPSSVLEVVLALLVALWSSIEAMACLQISLDVAYEVSGDRGMLGRRIAALPLVGVTLVLGGTASVLLVLGNPISHLVPGGVVPLLAVLRYAGSLLLVALLLSAYYGIGPARPRPEWEWISPGSVVATVGWVLVALAYSSYLDHFGNTTRTYGALAGVAVTLLWLYFTSIAILLGAELNRQLERLAGAQHVAPTNPGPIDDTGPPVTDQSSTTRPDERTPVGRTTPPGPPSRRARSPG